MSYDPKCEALAKYFIDGGAHTEEDIRKLAQIIQDAIEDWFIENGSAGERQCAK